MLMEGYGHVGFLMLWLLGKNSQALGIGINMCFQHPHRLHLKMFYRALRAKTPTSWPSAVYDPPPELTRTESSTGS